MSRETIISVEAKQETCLRAIPGKCRHFCGRKFLSSNLAFGKGDQRDER